MKNLHKLSISEMRIGLQSGEFSAQDLAMHYLNRIKHKDYGSYITVTEELAMQMAKESDIRIKNNTARPLEGIPLGIKDLFATKGVRTTGGSRILENFIPPYESTVTRKLWESGAVMVGKTSMDEFAMGAANTYTKLTDCRNPWKNDVIPGGSSGGSAVAVAAGLCAGSTGSDTGGSIRQPSAHCGIVGIRPTYGRVSRYGMFPFAQSLDQAGVMANSVKDCAHLFQQIAGYDNLDPTSANVKIDDYVGACDMPVNGMRIGILPRIFDMNISKTILNALRKNIDLLKEAGVEIVEIDLPHMEYSLSVYRVVAFAEAASSLARYDGIRYGVRVEGNDLNETYINSRKDGFGDEVRRRILVGTYVLSSENYDIYYSKAVKVRSMIMTEFRGIFDKVDAVLMPTTAGPAPSFSAVSDPERMYLEDFFTLPVNIACIGGMSVPVDMENELPISLQIVHGAFCESNAFKVASFIEKNAQFVNFITKMEV